MTRTTEGYRGNQLIKRHNTKLEFTVDQALEWAKCKADPIYFIETYMKIVSQGQLSSFKLWDYQKEIIRSFQNHRDTIIVTSRQAGKALPLNAKIPSPKGWRTMAELDVGDQVFDEHGKPTVVTAISPIFINHDCYKITFDDRSTVTCDANHLWQLNKKDVLSTKDMFEMGPTYTDSRGKTVSRWSIPTSKPVQYESQKVSIDPYLLGVWLGDGEAASGRITCHSDDLIEYKTAVGESFSHNHRTDHIYMGTVYTLMPRLRSYGILKNKRIPREYLQNNIEVRTALLQGLMDTDGWVEKSGQNCIALSYNRYPKLIDDVYELLTGLGLKVFRKQYPSTNSERLYFHCSKAMFPVFRLARKLEKQIETSQRPSYTGSRFIRSIEKVKSVPTKCITVANPSHLFLCSEHHISTHNSTTTGGFVLWYVLFHEYKNVALLANKAPVAREILGRIQFAYENLPNWLQQGVVEWNKGTVDLENNSKIFAAATSKTSIRGFTIDFLFIDEAAHIEKNVWEEFWTSVSQTLSSNPNAKTALISTPYGLNHFYEFYENAENPDPKKRNGFKRIKVTWREIPGRDDEWKRRELAKINNNLTIFRQEQEAEFLGSSGTLIDAWKLEELLKSIEQPVMKIDGLSQYERPQKDHLYCLVADTSEGKGLDYSAFNVFDITSMPYKQVCVFRDNMITPINYAEIIHRTAVAYNNAPVLVENNNVGHNVAHVLHFDFEYEGVLATEAKGRIGKKVTYGYSIHAEKGIRTTITVKANGCSFIKLLLEQNQLILQDGPTIRELTTFSRKGKSWQAEEGNNDDLVMTLVLFAWLTNQEFFKEMTDINTISKLRDRSLQQTEEVLTPFGFYNDGIQDDSDDLLLIDPLLTDPWSLKRNPKTPDADQTDALWKEFVYGKKGD